MEVKSAVKGFVLSAVMFAAAAILVFSATYAWFAFPVDLFSSQLGTIGKFEVKINNADNAYVKANSIGHSADNPFTVEYPINRAEAIKNADDANLNNDPYIYRFRVLNSGNITAMYRFVVTLVNTDAEGNDLDAGEKNLTQSLNYCVRYYDYAYSEWDSWNWPGYNMWREEYIDEATGPTRYFIEDSEDNAATNTSLQEFFDYLLMIYASGTPAQGDDPGTPPSLVASSVGMIYNNGNSIYQREFELAIWLSQNAKIETAANKKAEITLTMHAQQAVGGSSWDADIWTHS